VQTHSATIGGPLGSFGEHASQHALTEILEAIAAAPIGLVVFDRELRFVYVNSWLAEANGARPEAHLGRTMKDLLPDYPEAVAMVEGRVRTVLEAGQPSTFSVHRSGPEGARQEWVATYVPLRELSGDVHGACGIIIDVSDDRAREAAQARARATAERTARRLGYLQAVTAALSAAKDPAAVGEVVVTRAGQIVGAVAATFGVVRGGALDLVATAGATGVPARFSSIPLDADLPISAAVSSGEPIWLEDRSAVFARFPAAATFDGGHALAVLPLVTSGRVTGSLTFVFDSPQRFDLEERAFLLGVAEQSAQALDRALLRAAERTARGAAQRAAGRAVRLQAMTAALSGASTAEEVAKVVVYGARAMLGAKIALAYVLDRDGATLRLGAAVTTDEAHPGWIQEMPLDAPVPAAAAARTGEAYWLETRPEIAAEFPVFADLAPHADTFGALAALPLRARSQVLGSLGFAFDEERPFATEERELLSSVAYECAQALDRARLLDAERETREHAQRAAERLARLQEITAALSASRTPADVVETIGAWLRAYAGAVTSSAYAVEPGGSHLLRLGARGVDLPEPPRISVDGPLPACRAVATREPLWLESEEEVRAAFPSTGASGSSVAVPATLVALPLVAGGRVVGAVEFAFDRSRPFDPAERRLLLTVAEQCAVALDRARLLEDERHAREDAERVRAEADRARALLDAIVDNAPLGIGFFDADLRFQRVNAALAEINGLPVEAHAGRDVRSLLPGLPAEELEAACRRVAETGRPVMDVEIAGETPASARRRVFRASWYPVRFGGDTRGVGVLVRDVTKERDAEEFQRHVMGIVGHDLRNPLSAIVTGTKLLAGAELPARQAKLVARIAGSASRIEEIVRALLDFAAVRGARGVPLTRRRCDLVEIARAVAAECGLAHAAVRQIYCEGEGDCAGEWDPDRVAQLLTNLVSNALDHSAEGAAVTIRSRGEERDVVLEVANAGPPIPPEIAPRLFEPFRRGAGARSGGLGLGLFIARAIAEAHGGRIEVRSSEGEGTVFSVRLPRSPRTREADEGAPPRATFDM
jgi:PAS domain S-box-containing protein